MSNLLKNLLADYGYNLVALPRVEINPLLLLTEEDGNINPLGSSVTDMFDDDEVAKPMIFKNESVTDIAGSTGASYDASGGVNILEQLLTKLNLGKLKGDIKFDNNKILTIKYENVLEDRVNLLDLDAFISGSTPSKKKFNAYKVKLENSELYVINSVLKSNSFSVTIENKDGSKADVETTIKGILDVNGSFSNTISNQFTLKNPGQNHLVFAFKAQQIMYDKKEWWQFFKKESAGFTIKAKTNIVFMDESEFPSTPLIKEHTFVSI